MKKHYERKNHYAELTEKIVSELEKGRIPWHRPWNADLCAGPPAPFNAVTGRHYHGINVISLLLHPAAFVSGDPRFCTYDQAQKAGWQVEKGQHGTTIFWTGKVLAKPGGAGEVNEADHEDLPAMCMLRGDDSNAGNSVTYALFPSRHFPQPRNFGHSTCNYFLSPLYR